MTRYAQQLQIGQVIVIFLCITRVMHMTTSTDLQSTSGTFTFCACDYRITDIWRGLDELLYALP